MRVAVIGGGVSCEHEVSIASAAAVGAGLAPAYEVVGLTIARDGTWLDDGGALGNSPAASLAAALARMAASDVVFPVVHGPIGEDGTLAALCDLAGLPFVGSGLRGGALAMDKWTTKLVAQELGIRTASSHLVSAADRQLMTYEEPVVVKPVAAGSSHGVSLVSSAAALEPAIDAALALDDRALVEELIVGREIDIAVLQRANGSRFVGPALEIVVESGLFDTERKYNGSADFRVPADIDDVQRKEIENAALELFEALGCAGVARFDFFVTATGAVLNEVNTMPGLTAESQVPRMFAAAGLPYACLLDELVRGASVRTAARQGMMEA